MNDSKWHCEIADMSSSSGFQRLGSPPKASAAEVTSEPWPGMLT